VTLSPTDTEGVSEAVPPLAYGCAVDDLTPSSPTGDETPALTLSPAQQDVLELLRRPPGRVLTFDADLRHQLRVELEEGVAEALGDLPDGQELFVSKSSLAAVFGCEARFLHEDGFGGWTPAMARGTVAHRAIELSTSWRGASTPTLLVDVAIERLIDEGYGVGSWLTEADQADLAEVRGMSVERVTTFEECFPPLQPEWRPKPESKVKAYLAGGRVVLQGKVDLTIGVAKGLEARKVLLDLKTGSFHAHHRDDLRFYALLETLKLGTPPRLLGTYELDAGVLHREDVTLDVLVSAVRRTIDGVIRLVQLRHGGDEVTPTLRPGGLCRFCDLADSCDAGKEWLRKADESAGELLDL